MTARIPAGRFPSARPAAPADRVGGAPPYPAAAAAPAPDAAAAPDAAPGAAPAAPVLLDMHGLIHDSAWPVPGAHPAPPDAAAEVTARPGPVAPPPAEAPRFDDARLVAPSRVIITGRGLRMAVEDGARVTLDAPDAPEDLRRLLIGYSAGTVLLLQRGRMPLHAAAAAGPSGAVLLLGESGAGKSTLAAMLGARGLSLVGDDMIAVSVGAADGVEGAAVERSLRTAKLWSDSEAGLADAGARGARPGIEKSVLTWAAEMPGVPFPAPLRAVVHLGWLHPETARPRLSRLAPFGAVPLLTGAVARRPLAEAMGLAPGFMARAAQIAGAVPCYRLLRPRAFAATEETLDLVAGLVHSGGD
ncbi:hypothetical protein ACQ5SO_07935 [Rhodovulum sp. DZ06]|uniref:hypothetical protein n=1 Tax=Rhodovulum sp. DZ06 TaxID=3425126 RepID=UPI003D348439